MNSGGECRRCGTANVAAARFCKACGGSLNDVCPSCGTSIEPQARFCIGCGTSLERGQPPGEAAEERRTVTVLFADLVEYTSLAERLDHESVKAITDRCLTRLASEVERYGGYVDQYIGDNVMAVFGARMAHEDDPERGIRAGWAMQQAMRELNETLGREFSIRLALRVGVNTGEALAGRVGGHYTVVGDAVNVAARLQGAAPVGGILVGRRTRQSASAAVEFRERGALTLKGKADAVEAWEVLSVSDPGARRRAARPAVPLVGRQGELAQLQGLFDAVGRSGRGHLVSVVGEAGVGKTRLLEEAERTLTAGEPELTLLRARCHAFGSAAYLPLIELLRSECAIAGGEDLEQVRRKLAVRFQAGAPHQDPPGHFVSVLARALQGENLPAGPMPSEQDQREARESLLAAVRTALEALAAEGPVLLVWEDVHWADEGTLELIEYLGRWLTAPVMQVCLAREELLERRPAWAAPRAATTTIVLEPLSLAETRRLIDELARASAAVVDMPETLAARSGGNALFAEALVDRIVEEGAGGITSLPDTVQALLAARLDSLAPRERSVIGHAAVVGRSFSVQELASVAPDAALDASLASLCGKNLIVPADAGEGADRRYAFKHVLVRDAAYETLPLAVRARKHAEIAGLIEHREGEAPAALLAEHFSRAATLAADAHLPAAEREELRMRALGSCEAAGDGALALHATEAALAHYTAATGFAPPGGDAELRLAERIGELELRLGRTPQAIERLQGCLRRRLQEEELEHAAHLHGRISAAHSQQGELAAAMQQLRAGISLLEGGRPTTELIRLYEEGAALYDRLGEDMLAIYACERALRLARELDEPRATSRALAVLGRLLGRMGDATRARSHLAHAVELARDSGPAEEVVALLASGSNSEESEADYEQARATFARALALAERVGDVPAQIETLAALGKIACLRCEWEEAERCCAASALLGEREGLLGRLCMTQSLQARLRWREGRWEDSEELFVRAQELSQRAGWTEACSAALLGRAATLRDRGDLDGAEAALLEAVAVGERGALVGATIHAYSALTFVRSLAGRGEQAEQAADAATRVARRAHDPAARYAVLEAQGVAGWGEQAASALAGARVGWHELGRPLDAARCSMLLGRSLLPDQPREAEQALAEAEEAFTSLGVAHLAAQSRRLQPV